MKDLGNLRKIIINHIDCLKKEHLFPWSRGEKSDLAFAVALMQYLNDLASRTGIVKSELNEKYAEEKK